LAVFMSIQILTWNGKIFWVRPTDHSGHGGPFLNHNHLAAYLNMGLGFALAGLVAQRPTSLRGGGRGSLLWLAYTGGVLLVGIFGSLSRSGLVGTLLAIVACLITLRPWARRQTTRLGLGIGLGLMVAV